MRCTQLSRRGKCVQSPLGCSVGCVPSGSVAVCPDAACDSFHVLGETRGAVPTGGPPSPAVCFITTLSLVGLLQDNHGNSVHLGIFFMGIFVRNRIGRQAVIHRYSYVSSWPFSSRRDARALMVEVRG